MRKNILKPMVQHRLDKLLLLNWHSMDVLLWFNCFLTSKLARVLASTHAMLQFWWQYCLFLCPCKIWSSLMSKNSIDTIKDWYFGLGCCRWLFYRKCMLLHKSFLFPFSSSFLLFSGNRILKFYSCPCSQTILETFKALISWSIEASKEKIKKKKR